ncbi:MAG: HD-GYP domain-containing protein [Clostridia bacterium]
MKENNIDFYNKTSLKSYNLDESIRYQLSMLDSLDVFTRKHSENVANITCRLCERLKLGKDFTVYCTTCAFLHDVGKLFIPPSILQKQGPLTDEEYEVMKTHTTLGYNMCMEDIKLRPYANGALYHHEALNGSGYPNHVTKKDIPIEGQIIRVADEFDAIVSKRQYKSHIGITDTLKLLVQEAQPIPKSIALKSMESNTKLGKLNPKVVRALFKVVIEDTEYEISCIMDYMKYIDEQIKRLQIISDYNFKMQKSKKEKKKDYYKACMDSMFEGGENIRNFNYILEEYSAVYLKKKETVNNLFNEIKQIKKLRV